MSLLSVESLAVRLPPVTLLSDVSFQLAAGETLGIVGESGSGKSMLALALMGLLPAGAVASGRVRFQDEDILTLPEAAMGRVRGQKIGMIFQEPMTALNPAMTVGDQVAEGLVWHTGMGWRAARRQAVTLLDRVRIADAARRASAYPHELSGGQRQRVGIAMALALQPAVMIADEPTTALDVTVQAEILDILDGLVRETGMALILISHDLGVIARSTERTLVLYAGTMLEAGATADVLQRPLNPYTRGLLAAMPRRRPEGGRLPTIPGTVPSPRVLSPGCRFAGRCAEAIAECAAVKPAWRLLGDRGVRCIRA